MCVIRLDPATASPFHKGEFEGWGTSLCYSPEQLAAAGLEGRRLAVLAKAGTVTTCVLIK